MAGLVTSNAALPSAGGARSPPISSPSVVVGPEVSLPPRWLIDIPREPGRCGRSMHRTAAGGCGCEHIVSRRPRCVKSTVLEAPCGPSARLGFSPPIRGPRSPGDIDQPSRAAQSPGTLVGDGRVERALLVPVVSRRRTPLGEREIEERSMASRSASWGSLGVPANSGSSSFVVDPVQPNRAREREVRWRPPPSCSSRSPLPWPTTREGAGAAPEAVGRKRSLGEPLVGVRCRRSPSKLAGGGHLAATKCSNVLRTRRGRRENTRSRPRTTWMWHELPSRSLYSGHKRERVCMCSAPVLVDRVVVAISSTTA